MDGGLAGTEAAYQIAKRGIKVKLYEMKPEKFEKEEKLQLVNILNQEVTIDGKRNYVVNAIKIYCKSVFDAINDNDVSLIRFYSNEL